MKRALFATITTIGNFISAVLSGAQRGIVAASAAAIIALAVEAAAGVGPVVNHVIEFKWIQSVKEIVKHLKP